MFYFSVKNNITLKIIKRQLDGNKGLFCPCDIINLFNIYSDRIHREVTERSIRTKWIRAKFHKLFRFHKIFFETQMCMFFPDIQTIRYCRLHNILY